MIRPQASKPGSGSRFRGSFGRQKPSFLENFRTTLSGPQHLPIAKNEEAKRHDRGTLSQNEAFVACPALRANNAFTPLRSVRSAKNYNSPASSSAVRPSTKKRHNWNDLEIVANCKDTPIRRCGGNQRGNWRNERRPCVAMTGPTRAGDKSTTPRYGSPYDGEPDSLASMDWSRRTFPAVRRITIRWKLDLILLNPPNHTSSIPAAGVNFATSL